MKASLNFQELLPIEHRQLPSALPTASQFICLAVNSLQTTPMVHVRSAKPDAIGTLVLPGQMATLGCRRALLVWLSHLQTQMPPAQRISLELALCALSLVGCRLWHTHAK
eukprot:1769041-Amphidinium_carterae.1